MLLLLGKSLCNFLKDTKTKTGDNLEVFSNMINNVQQKKN